MPLKFMFLDSLAKTFRKCSLIGEFSYVRWPKTQANHWTKEKKGNYKHDSQEFRLSLYKYLLTLLEAAQIMLSLDS